MARRKGGLFLPLDVGFPDDDRVVEAGERAAWLYVCMALASKRLGTDGILTTRQIDRLHVPSWRDRLARLLAVELVLSVGEDLYGIASWFNHNDPVAVVRERRAKDAERKRNGSPNGVRTETERSPSVEKREEEKSTSAAPGTPVDNRPCEHGTTSSRLCALCRIAARAVAS